MTQQSNQEVIERAMKIYALAQRGEGGEAANASAILSEYLRKNHLTIDDLLTGSDDSSRCFRAVLKTKEEGVIVVSYLQKLTGKFRENLDTYQKGGCARYTSTHKGLTRVEYNIAEAFVPLLLEAYRRTASAMRKRHAAEKKALIKRQDAERSMRLSAFLNENECFLKSEQSGKALTSSQRAAYFSACNDVEELPEALLGSSTKLLGGGE